MAFAQLTYRESLRDIETCLRALDSRLYHMGIKSTVSRNNLSHANEIRDWRIYADFAQILINRAKALYANEQLALNLEATAYALDSTTHSCYLSILKSPSLPTCIPDSCCFSIIVLFMIRTKTSWRN